MPLRRKLLLAMLIPAVLLGMMGAIGVFSLRYLERAAGRILADNYHSIQDARRMQHALRCLEFGCEGPQNGVTGATGAVQATAQFERALMRCESNITVSGEASVLSAVRQHWDRVRHAMSGRGAATERQPPRERVSLERLHAELEALVALNERAMFAYERDTRRAGRMMVGAAAVSVFAAMIALAFFALVSARRISGPVTQVADRLHLALNPVEPHSPASGSHNVDEIARLRQELDALLGRLTRYEDEQNRRVSHLQGRLAVVMNEVLEGLVLLDEQHRIVSINRVARLILGTDGATGLRLDALPLRPDLRAVLEPLLAGHYQVERDLGELDDQIDGEQRVYRPRALTVAGDDGTVEGYLLLFWDVTEQRRFEASRHRFISMLSHQLKTPMTSLLMSVTLLREKLLDLSPAQTELLSIAAENCNSLSALVSDLISAARDATHVPVATTRQLDLIRLLRGALRPLVPQAEEKGVLLVVPPADGEVIANVDPVKFPWVVTNIAGNALRYTGRGGEVRVTVGRASDGIEVSVADTGAGIAPENLDRIFRPYVSLDDEPLPGTHGLGLTIAHEIVQAHGGRVEVESQPGVGTRFRIVIPAPTEAQS